jgi:hypothetical protein
VTGPPEQHVLRTYARQGGKTSAQHAEIKKLLDAGSGRAAAAPEAGPPQVRGGCAEVIEPEHGDTVELALPGASRPSFHGVLHAAILEEIENSLAFMAGSKLLPRGQRKPVVGPIVRDYLADQIAWLVIGLLEKTPEPTEWGDATTQWTWGLRQPDGTPGRKGPIVSEATARLAVAEPFEVAGYVKALLTRDVGAWRETD